MLTQRLNPLPAQALPAARPFIDWLDGIGCHSLAQLRSLPRKGLQQRSAPLLLQPLDAAYGDGHDQHSWFQAPARFTRRYDLTERLEHCRSEGRRVGKAFVWTGRSRWSPCNRNKKTRRTQ